MAASRSRMAWRCGLIFGRSQISVTSTLMIRPPFAETSEAACSRNRSLEAPFHFGSVGGKWSPMSPSPMAPRIASVSA